MSLTMAAIRRSYASSAGSTRWTRRKGSPLGPPHQPSLRSTAVRWHSHTKSNLVSTTSSSLLSSTTTRSSSTSSSSSTQSSAAAATSTQSTTTTSSQHQQHSHRWWEVASASLLAFVASASLVVAFPSSRTRSEAAHHHVPLDLSAWGSSESVTQTTSNNTSNVVSSLWTRSSQPKNYDVSVRAVKGGRVTMEDEYLVANGGRFVAVFDGHGGGGVSNYLQKSLYDKLEHYLKEKHWEQSTTPRQGRPSLSTHVTALRCAFTAVEDEVLQRDAWQYQGSTAVAVLLHEGDPGKDQASLPRTLLSANVGDSRAILSRQQQAVELTRDHKPNEEKEKARILSQGEEIEWDPVAKVHRVRNLSLSRAIGDRYAKPVVSAEVEIQHFPIIEDQDEFYLLASDGLWDVMTSQDVVSYVHQRMKNELNRPELSADDRDNYEMVLRRNMAKFLAMEALRRGSADNVCVLMVWLKDGKAN